MERFVPYNVRIMRMSKNKLEAQIRDPAWVEEFLSWIPRGLPHRSICRAMGVPYRHFEDMKYRADTGTAGDEVVEFIQRVGDADCLLEAELVSKIISASGSDWKAALAFLERRFGENWSTKLQIRNENINVDAGKTELESMDTAKLIEDSLKLLLKLQKGEIETSLQDIVSGI